MFIIRLLFFLIPLLELASVDARRICSSTKTPERLEIDESRFAAFVSRFELANSWGLKRQSNRTVNVPVYWNVIHRNMTVEGGYMPDKYIYDTIAAMNEHYRGSGFRFTLRELVRTRNPEWFLKVSAYSDLQGEMKRELRQGGPESLNVYTVGFEEVPEEEKLLGYAYFPEDYEGNPKNDGVVIMHTTVVGGSERNYNLGGTLTHEVGHWLGLYHTFEGGCNSPTGDYVSDTPPEREAATGCDIGKDTCPGNGRDSIHNFMNYSFDSCYTQFTRGQMERMQQHWRMYRG